MQWLQTYNQINGYKYVSQKCKTDEIVEEQKAVI